jgi:hypothetical protein
VSFPPRPRLNHPSGAECPRCDQNSPCVDWCEVDNGVGVQTWDHEYQCPTHGRFTFVFNTATDDLSYGGEIVWRDEEKSPAKEEP